MNILFVNYGDFTTNSLNHISGFANTLCAAGHACIVAVSQDKATLAHLPSPLFIAATYAELLARPGLFPDGKPADLIHAWTPREGVRKFTIAYQRAALALGSPAARSPATRSRRSRGQRAALALGSSAARLVIHLEDNERFLLEAYTGKSFAALRESTPAEIDAWLLDSLPHPLRHEAFLRTADGVTHIVDRLRDFVPAGIPTQLLPPGVDFTLYAPQLPDVELRTELGLRDGERVIAFTGSNTFANEPELRELYVAVALLNQRGIPTRLVRTGFNSPKFLADLSPDLKAHVLDLGFVAKSRLPQLLALAEVLVQPGHPGAFNDYRLPSKLPEFLASGRPVVLPPTNLAALLTDGREAVFLPATGTPAEIADTCQLLFSDPALCTKLGKKAVAFARAHFDLATNTRALTAFYTATLARPSTTDWALITPPTASETTLAFARADRAARALGAPAASLAAETDLLAHLVRQLELALDANASIQHIAQLTADCDASLTREKLSRDHIANLDALLAAAQENVAATNRSCAEQIAAERECSATLEHARLLTKNHADNLERELAITRGGYDEAVGAIAFYKKLKEQADALLKSARIQVVAYENALIQADARIAALENSLTVTEEALVLSRDETRVARENHATAAAALRAQFDAERAAFAAQAAADHAAAATRLAEAHAVTRSREEKLAKLQSSFSWQVTSPLRALRRVFLDRSSAPSGPAVPVSDQFHSNIDRPQSWAAIPATLNLLGWTLRKDKAPIRGIRARLGSLTITAQTGVERLDVLDHFRDFPGAEHCGWMLKLEVPKRGTHSLVLEAQDESGAWSAFLSRSIKRTSDDAPPPPNSYAAWIAAYDRLTPEIADQIRAKIAALPNPPLISVLMPTYNTGEKWLIRAIESVRRQLYPNWELCIADDASQEPHVRKILAAYQQKDPRIKVVYRETNGHISATSNSALALAHGEFIALLDHDDEIRPHALACVAFELHAHPDADLIYSDEDKIDENGDRYDHYFKPDWNADLFNVQNYISHLGVYRTLLVREVGGFRVGYEGSQDWDLAMRVIERTAPDRIRHIPKILYHWRSIPGSTAMVIGAKSYATNAAEKVITEHFARLGVDATLTPTKGSYWRVHYPIPDPAPLVTLIIPTRNRLDFLQPCVESLLSKTTYANFELLIVDNDSNDPATLAYLSQLSALGSQLSVPRTIRILHYPGEFNYAAINNFAVEHTDAPVVALLNNDLEIIHGDWLDEMVSHALRPEIGAVGAKLYYPDDRIQHAGVILGIGGVAAHAWQTHPRGAAGQAHRNLLQQNLSAVTAACLVIRREVYQQVGGLNADQLKVAFNDVDFCLKVRAAGYRNLWTPYAELYHHESASRGPEDTLEKRDRFRSEVEYMRSTWGEILDNDPAYNPNLTHTINDFTLAVPPREWPPLK